MEANILRKLASKTKSPEIEINTLKVRSLNECYGSLPVKPSVNTEDIIQLELDHPYLIKKIISEFKSNVFIFQNADNHHNDYFLPLFYHRHFG